MVHRILQDKLDHRQKSYGNKLNEISEHISAQERKAIDAERESNKYFQAKFLEDKVGEEFEGTVSGLADFGRSEEHTSELQSRPHLVCRLLLEKKKKKNKH